MVAARVDHVVDHEPHRLGPEAAALMCAVEPEVDRDAAVVGLLLFAHHQHPRDLALDLDRQHDLVVLGIEQVPLHPRGVPAPEPARNVRLDEHRQQRGEVVVAHGPQHDTLSVKHGQRPDRHGDSMPDGLRRSCCRP